MFKNIWIGVFALILPILCFAGDKEQLLKTKMLSDLDIIKNTFEVKYAPAEWKKHYAQWDLEEKISEAKAKVLAKDHITVRDYQKILSSFFNSTRDYHVSVQFHSTSVASLPFRVQGANGRYFIAWIDHRLTSLPLAVGDEILKFDGKPIGDVIAELKAADLGNPDSKTDQSKAEMFLTARIGALGLEVPKGAVTITVQHAHSKKVSSYTVNWSYLPEEIKSDNVYKAARMQQAVQMPVAKNAKVQPLTDRPFFHKKMTYAFYDTWRQALHKQYGNIKREAAEGEPDPLGAKKSFIPSLGHLTWQSRENDHFHAYMYKTPDQKTIAYVRIPIYEGTEAMVNEFQNLINLFEERSDALIIDQVDNPGGEVFYMYALASMLHDYPLELPTHRFTITQEDAMFAIEALEDLKKYKVSRAEGDPTYDVSDNTISGYPVTPELIASLKRHFQFILNEWNEGKTFTKPDYLYGIKHLLPHPKAQYTKPILVLVNHMAFSCGDFFPAALQDNKRATIFGTRTAGAGGFVLEHSHPNRLSIASYRLTASLAERLDKKPIENLGVTPDIIYEITAEDLQNNFAGYAGAVQKAVQKLVNKK